MKLALTTIFCLALTSCSQPRRVVIEYEGSKLTYDCANFQPQAKTAADSRAIMGKTREVVGRARESGNWVLFRSLNAARDLRDVKRLEELIVRDECARLK
jgi:hypothetical protein